MRRLLLLPLLLWIAVCVQAHPLGNFTINHYVRIDSRPERLLIKLVIDMAEIPTFQELSAMGLKQGELPDQAQCHIYLTGMAEQISKDMHLSLNQQPVGLKLVSSKLEFPEGQGGLRTLRAVFWWEGTAASEATVVEFSEESYAERTGWREIVVNGGEGKGLRLQSLSHELTAYPEDMLLSPLNERKVSFISRPALFKEVVEIDSVIRPEDSFTALVSSSYSDPRALLLALLTAFLLGAFHALSPGHGKTLVAAYLVASRATVRNAVLLGGSVTFTHTASVFLLGLVTLTLSQYVLPERLYPWIGVFSGLAVVVMGTYMLMQRLQSYFGIEGHGHSGIFHTHSDGHAHSPGWRGVVWMGVTGGALPCPSALVVLLGAIAMHRIAFGMLLIVAFSLGLASVLVLTGVLLVKARGLLERIGSGGRAAELLPVLSSVVIILVGIGISVEALGSGNLLSGGFLTHETLYATIGLGFALGLHHALDTDHIVAVSTIVSEQRKWWQSSLVGVVWGIGHTTSLFLVAICVIFFKLVIPDTLAKSLELCVAFMLIGLGVNLVLKTYRRTAVEKSTKLTRRPFLIGMVHGLAGSAALMLVVLTTIPSPLAGIIYVMVFGLGSVGGMLVMSSLIGLPIVLTADRFERWAHYLKFAAGTLSALFGLLLAWELLVDEGLFRELFLAFFLQR